MLFKKKSNDRRINQDSIVSIPCYGPNDNLSTQDYKVPTLLANFELEFEKICKSWLKNAKPDMYNSSYMDNLIEQYEAEAIVMLENQSVDHQSAIYELCKIWAGDAVKANVKLEETVTERKKVESNIKLLEQIYFAGTAYELANKDTDEKEIEKYE